MSEIEYVNLTGSTIRMLDGNGDLGTVIPPGDTILQFFRWVASTWGIGGFRVNDLVVSAEGLPETKPGVIVIVLDHQMSGLAMCGIFRDDIVTPAGMVLDDDGNVYGYRRFDRVGTPSPALTAEIELFNAPGGGPVDSADIFLSLGDGARVCRLLVSNMTPGHDRSILHKILTEHVRVDKVTQLN
jgi:hypothetical protein